MLYHPFMVWVLLGINVEIHIIEVDRMDSSLIQEVKNERSRIGGFI